MDKKESLAGLIGKHFIYTYDNGWQYEFYVKNEHLDLMKKYRDESPTYPKTIVDEFATITFLEDCGADNNKVINCAPDQLPDEYTTRKK